MSWQAKLILLCVMLIVQGCANVASTGAQVIYNRQSLQKSWSDQYITIQAYQAISVKNGLFKDANITIATMHGEVLLTGQVPEAWQKAKAEALVRKIPNVKTVYNLIVVASPCSALTRISDTWITTKIKAQLLASNDVDATQIKVVTENGKVYLMGTLLPEEAEVAVDIARTTEGVQSVVKIFSYISISKRITKYTDEVA